MPKRDDDFLIMDILESYEAIEEYVKGYSYSEFLNDRKTIDAVVRNFEIIGEASKMISIEMKKEHSLVKWRMMSDFRNILIHEYFGIDYEVLWHSVKHSLPQNIELIKQIKF